MGIEKGFSFKLALRFILYALIIVEQERMNFMKLKKVFERKETKYLLTNQQFTNFLQDLEKRMIIDEFGLHTIQSLYYDTNDDYFIKHSIEKPRYKEKFRVRSYGQASSEKLVFLEMKKKVNGIVYKRRLPLSYDEYKLWEATGLLPEKLEKTQIAKEISWLFQTNPDLHAKVLIAYDRLSFFYKEDETFRVTFDQKIRFRNQWLELDRDTYQSCEPVAKEVDVLMEVKAMGAYPLWFSHLLADHHIYKASFSKYAQTYQRHLFIPQKEITFVKENPVCKGAVSYVG